jgi:hypothetical protein
MSQHIPPSPYPARTACYTAADYGRSAKPARSLLTELFRPSLTEWAKAAISGRSIRSRANGTLSGI